MKIIRNLRDSRQVKFLEDTIKATTIEIELTDAEIEQAYRERRLYYNIEDIKHKVENMIEDTDDEVVKEIYREKLKDPEWLRDTAEWFDDALDLNDSYWESFWATAEFTIIEQMIEEE